MSFKTIINTKIHQVLTDKAVMGIFFVLLILAPFSCIGQEATTEAPVFGSLEILEGPEIFPDGMTTTEFFVEEFGARKLYTDPPFVFPGGETTEAFFVEEFGARKYEVPGGSTTEAFFVEEFGARKYEDPPMGSGGTTTEAFFLEEFGARKLPPEDSAEATGQVSTGDTESLTGMLNPLVWREAFESCNAVRTSDSQTCEDFNNFKLSTLTLEQVLSWIVKFDKHPILLRQVFDPQNGISDAVFDELKGHAASYYFMLPQSVVEMIVESALERLGKNLKQLQAADVEMLGHAFILGVPSSVIRQLPAPILDSMLDRLSTDMMHHFNKDSSQGTSSQEPSPPFPLFMFIAKSDKLRLKSLCAAAFKQYKSVTTGDVFRKIMPLLGCAPAHVCKNVDAALVIENAATITQMPFACYETRGKIPEGLRILIDMFPDSKPCGREIVKKLRTDPSMSDLSQGEAIERLKSLLLCADTPSLIKASVTVPCNEMQMFAMDIYPKAFTDAVARRCLEIPQDASQMTCETLSSNYAGFMERLPKKFWASFPADVMCTETCLEAIKQSDAKHVQRMVLDKCFGENAPLSATPSVSMLGGMVSQLPVSLLGEVPASDLLGAIADIKQSAKESGRGKAKNMRVAMKTIAQKMKESGNIKEIADSREMMKQVSLKDLKSALTNIESDLGLDDPSKTIALTGAQKKWVMKKVLESKKAEDLSVDELRSKKEIITGFSSKDINRMQSGDASGIEKAMALCEAKDWPLKPLKAINRNLIMSGLEARDSENPLSAFTTSDVENIGCECLMHFTGAELEAMDSEVCIATCIKVGSCDNFRCLNPKNRRETAAACLKCMGLTVEALTETDWDSFGLNLVAQLPATSLASIPAAVVTAKMHQLKELCMNVAQLKSLIPLIITNLGGDIAAITEAQIQMMGSSIKWLTENQLKQLDKMGIALHASQISSELSSGLNTEDKLQECCLKWLSDADKETISQQNSLLMVALKNAIIFEMQNSQRRRRRATSVKWTCSHVRTLQEAFTTVTAEEIQQMENDEFATCLAELGALNWPDEMKPTLLEKAKTALSVNSICSDLTSNDAISLGGIIQALTVEEIECLIMDQDLFAAFGSLSGWAPEKLTALAQHFLEIQPNLQDTSALDVSTLGSIICGFDETTIGTLQPSVMAESGAVIGSLTDCTPAQMAAFVAIAIDDQAYGPVNIWSAAEVSELGNTLTGLSAAQLKSLTTTALEGLSDNVIPYIPVNVFSEITPDQFKSLTDIQMASLTTEQKNALPAELKDIVETLLPPVEEVTKQAPTSPPAGAGDIASNMLLMFLSLLIHFFH